MAYEDLTICDRNPVKRWIHRHRFSDALAVLKMNPSGGRAKVLDFGAGDGELVRMMAAAAPINASVYEPSPSLMAEAKRKLASLESVTFLDRVDQVASGSFDYVFCLEVFEHLPARETGDAIAQIDRLLKVGGVALIGVPHELFLPALLKGLFRMCRRYGGFDTRPGNILASALGRPPLQRPVGEISPGLPFHFHHLGFDYRSLRKLLQDRFRLEKMWFSPFSPLGALLNSEVYFRLRKAR